MSATKDVWVTESVVPVAPGIVFDGLPVVCLLLQRLKGFPDDTRVVAGALAANGKVLYVPENTAVSFAEPWGGVPHLL